VNGTQDPNTDPVQAMLAQTSLRTTLFAPTSRYYGLDTASIVVEHRDVLYLLRRFVPSPERFALIQEHTVTQAERLDNVTARYLGDPALFWRICDANRAMRPDELTATIGRKLRITLPDGITGTLM
jgi:hypothetical protein